MGLQDDFCLSALVPQNALPSDLLENALCGVAFGLGVLGTIIGIVFFLCSQRPCSGGKSPGKVREPGTRVPCQCVPGFSTWPVYSFLVAGDPVTDTVIWEHRNSLE